MEQHRSTKRQVSNNERLESESLAKKMIRSIDQVKPVPPKEYLKLTRQTRDAIVSSLSRHSKLLSGLVTKPGGEEKMRKASDDLKVIKKNNDLVSELLKLDLIRSDSSVSSGTYRLKPLKLLMNSIWCVFGSLTITNRFNFPPADHHDEAEVEQPLTSATSTNGGLDEEERDILKNGVEELAKQVRDLKDLMQSERICVQPNGLSNCIAVSPDGSLCAVAKNAEVRLLDLASKCEVLYTLDATDPISALCFSPNRFWLCVAMSKMIKIFDLENKAYVGDLDMEFTSECVSLNCSLDGRKLISNHSDDKTRIWHLLS